MGAARHGKILMRSMNLLSPRLPLALRARNFANALAIAGLLAAATTSASAKDDVTVKLTASKITAAKDGKEKLIAADTARPGEVIEYSAVYRNETKQPVKGLEATVPIPAGLELLPDTALPAAPLASANGADFAAMPLMAPPVDGKSAPVPMAEYRALRWAIPQLAPGAIATVKLRARVLTNQPTKTASR